jgi:UDP-galactopyranose mutase
MNILVVGAGLSGCTIAERLASLGHSITIIEKREHIGGNCYDYKNELGIMMNKYGPHLFHTNSERVWEYVCRFSEWVPWKHMVLGILGDKYFPIPVNIDTVNILLGTHITSEEDMKYWLCNNVLQYPVIENSEQMALSRVGQSLYELIFKNYTFKQWAKNPHELDASVLARIPVRTNRDPYYFSDKYQSLPKHGYTCFIKNMINHQNINVLLNTEYSHNMRSQYDRIFFTGPIDQYYADRNIPRLEYRSIMFEILTLEVDKFQPCSQVNYPSAAVPFTRIVEYKHFLNQNVSPGKTTIVREYTTGEGDPYYPVPNPTNKAIYEQYKKLAVEEEKKGVYFVGRLANYKYYNMDEAILAALEIVDLVV